MSQFEVKKASAAEFATAVEWAALEGWNPGLDDLQAFHHTDPGGFYLGWHDGQPVSSISVVRYGQPFGFLGFYIVDPRYRGKGYGLETWNVGMDYLGERTVGLDGVPDQVENYRRSGFVHNGINIRFSGAPDVAAEPGAGASCSIRAAGKSDMASLMAFDSPFFPAPRREFLSQWLDPKAASSRETLLAARDGELLGYATCRACRSGYKIGPLFALTFDGAHALLTAVISKLPEGSNISLDVPQANKPAVKLARSFGLEPSFETARMYRGPAPELPIDNIFGITTFELG